MNRWRKGVAVLLLGGSGCLPAAPAAAPDDALLKAQVKDGSGNAVSREAFMERAARAQLVCLGEQHDDADHHVFQQALWHMLAEHSQRDGRALALGLEMVQQPFQPALDDYLHGHLNAKELATAVEWPRRWGYDFGFFKPLFHSAHELGADVLALNAPRELTRQVARHGLKSLSHRQRARLPKLDLQDEGHRRFFWDAMGFDAPAGRHGHSPGGAHKHDSTGSAHKHDSTHKHDASGSTHKHDAPSGSHKHGAPASPHHGGAAKQMRFYTAQVIWDESMASAAGRWLHNNRHGRLLVLAGNGHCHTSAIVRRVKRRVNVEALSVLLAPKGHPLSDLAKRDFVIEVGRSAAPEPSAP